MQRPMPADDDDVLFGSLHSAPVHWEERVLGRPLSPVEYTFTVLSRENEATEPFGRLAVRRLQLEERLDGPYHLEITLAADDPDIDTDALLGRRVALTIARDRERRIHGVVLAAEITGNHAEGTFVRLDVGPGVSLLGLGRRSRVFQDLSAVDVIAAVLAEHGETLADPAVHLVGDHPRRDYCVQYRESDLDFILRLCAEEGIAMLFDQSADDCEIVVLVDDAGSMRPAGEEPLGVAGEPPIPPPILPWVPDRSEAARVESVWAARRERRAVPTQCKGMRFDWKARPVDRLAAAAPSRAPFSRGQFASADEGRPDEGEGSNGPIRDDSTARARLLRDRQIARAVRLCAHSNATMLRAGSTFELIDPESAVLAARWLVTRIVHRGEVPDATLHDGADGAPVELGYESEIEAQELALPYRPPARDKPMIPGVQTAIVTGQDATGIHTDRYGRIRVQMLWDETPSAPGRDTSCWLRMSQPWAGDGFGTVFTPRIGTEVVVSFVDGDPDRPLCMGCVYDGAAMPPYELPDERTRTVLRTRSTDGDGFNELSFQDEAGREEIFVHAQRNLREVVRAGHSCSVGGTYSNAVGRDRRANIGRDDETTIERDRNTTILGDDRYQLAGRLFAAIGGKEGIEGAEVRLDKGDFVLRVIDGFVLECGSSRIEVRPDRIELSSPMILAKCQAREGNTVSIGDTGVEIRGNEVFSKSDDGASLKLRSQAVLSTTEKGAASLDLREGGVSLRADASVAIDGTETHVTASEAATVEGSSCSVRGLVVEVAAESALSATSGGTSTMTATGIMALTGAVINLN